MLLARCAANVLKYTVILAALTLAAQPGRAERIQFEYVYTDPDGVGFKASAAMREALEYAGQHWSSFLGASYTDETIRIVAKTRNFDEGDVLARAGPVFSFEGGTRGTAPDTLYGSALYNHLQRRDVRPGQSPGLDSEIWVDVPTITTSMVYFGTDGSPPTGAFDMVSVFMHEIGHGLGLVTGMDQNGLFAAADKPQIPSIYDRNIVVPTPFPNSPRQPLVNQSASDRKGLAVSNALAWGGVWGTDMNRGLPVGIHSPRPFEPGSSVSHVEVNGTAFVYSLMEPSIGPGEVQHDPNPAELGMLRDMGWDILRTSTVDDRPPSPLLALASTREATVYGCLLPERCFFELGRERLQFTIGLPTGDAGFRSISLPRGFGDGLYRLAFDGIEAGGEFEGGVSYDLRGCDGDDEGGPCRKRITISGIEQADAAENFTVSLAFMGSTFGTAGLVVDLPVPGTPGLFVTGIGLFALARRRRPRGTAAVTGRTGAMA